MFHSLRSRLTLAFLLVSLSAVVFMAFVLKNITAIEFQIYLERVPFWARSMFFPREVPPVRALVGFAEEQYLASIRSSLWRAAGLVTVISGIVGLFLAHRLSRPLNQLTDAATEIATKRPGQLADLAPPPLPGQGEVERLSRAFHAMAKSLDEQERQRRQFLADITHELRTPLTIVQGRLEAMLDGVIEPTPDELATLHTQALLLRRLVHDLEMLALAQAKALTLHMSESDPVTLASEALQAHVVVAQKNGIHLRLDVPAPLPVFRTDQQRLIQVLHNLLANALRHTRAGGTVTLRVEKLHPQAGADADARHGLDRVLPENKEGIAFSVVDTGEGIPKSALSSIFDPFTRVDPSRNRRSGGTGLGLAIVQYLVEAHNGAVWIRSAEGVGTSVTVWLPLDDDEGAEESTEMRTA